MTTSTSRFTFALLLTVLCAGSALHAQTRPAAAPQNSLGVYFQMYTDMGGFHDPDTDSQWVFGDNAFGFGAFLQRPLGQSLLVGVDVGYVRPSYEQTPDLLVGEALVRGETSVVTALVSGRIAYGGGGDLGLYLTGGAGTIVYQLGDSWNPDLALRAGTGIEYRMSPTKAAFLEWGRLWGYHEKEGVSGGKATHSLLKIGGRFGL